MNPGFFKDNFSHFNWVVRRNLLETVLQEKLDSISHENL